MSNTDNTNKTETRKRKNFLSQLFGFIWERKAYWIVPVVIFLILLIALIFIGTSPVAPFVYTMV